MFGMTIGQVFELFDGLTAYIIMTSPYGGGDEDEVGGSGSPHPAGVRTNIGIKDRGADMVARNYGLQVRHVNESGLPDHIKALFKKNAQN